ncbi:DgyrCDS5249 [Dimorphilus gyrociliatus]|uniref:DgyrCDS5249 n=1 Tax=Dimorphilus gyrociliatus TaxID=2664684 RepID=A0A7I8VP49_9ANNE|nr:DgyrCDS5249 [Dimorphilus gyrociliatus]
MDRMEIDEETVQEFFKEITKCEKEMSSILTIFTPERGQTFLNSKFLFDSLQTQIKRTNDWRDKVIELRERGQCIMVSGEPIIHKRFLSLCSIKSGNVQLSKGEEFFIEEAQGERVKVKTSKGDEGLIPALSCIIPSPDLSAKNATERLQLVLLAVLNDSWKRFRSALVQSVAYNSKHTAYDWKRKVKPTKAGNRDRVSRRFKRLNEVVVKFPSNFDISKLHKALFSLERELVDCKANENIIETIAYLDKATLCFESFTKQYDDYKSSLAELSKPILVVEHLNDLQKDNRRRNIRYLEMKMTLTETEKVQFITYKDKNDIGQSTTSLRTSESKNIIRRNSKKYLTERSKFLKRLQKLNNIPISTDKPKYVRFETACPKSKAKLENSHELKSIKKRKNSKRVREMIKEDLKMEKKYPYSGISSRNTYIINDQPKKDSGKDQLETKNIIYSQNKMEGWNISEAVDTGSNGLDLNIQANSTNSNGSYSSDGFLDKQTANRSVHSFSSDNETESLLPNQDSPDNSSTDILVGDELPILSHCQNTAFKNSSETYSSFDNEQADVIDIVLKANTIEPDIVVDSEYSKTIQLPSPTLKLDIPREKVNIDTNEFKDDHLTNENDCQEPELNAVNDQDKLPSEEQNASISKSQIDESPYSILSDRSNSINLKRNRSFESALKLTIEEDNDKIPLNSNNSNISNVAKNSLISSNIDHQEPFNSNKPEKESEKGKKNDFAKILKEKWKKTFSKTKNSDKDKDKKRKNNFPFFKKGKSKKLRSNVEIPTNESPNEERKDTARLDDDEDRYQRLELRRSKLRNSCSNIDKLTKSKYSEHSLNSYKKETTSDFKENDSLQRMDISENKENVENYSKEFLAGRADLGSNIMHTNVDPIGNVENETQNKANTLFEDGIQTKENQDSGKDKSFENSIDRDGELDKGYDSLSTQDFSDNFNNHIEKLDELNPRQSSTNEEKEQFNRSIHGSNVINFSEHKSDSNAEIEQSNIIENPLKISISGIGRELASEVSSVSDDYVLAKEYLDSPMLGFKSSAYSTPCSHKKLALEDSSFRRIGKNHLLKGIESEISSTSDEYEQALESLTNISSDSKVASETKLTNNHRLYETGMVSGNSTEKIVNVNKQNSKTAKENDKKHNLKKNILAKQGVNRTENAKPTTFQSADVDTLLKDQSKAQTIDLNQEDYRCCIDFTDEDKKIKLEDNSVKNPESIIDSSKDLSLNDFNGVNNVIKTTFNHSNTSAITSKTLRDSRKSQVYSKTTANDELDVTDGSDDQIENAWQGAIIIRDFQNRSSIRRRRSKSLPSYIRKEHRSRPTPVKSMNYKATSSTRLDWRILCSIKRQLIATDNLRSTKKETEKKFVIRGILNPNNAVEEFSLEEAISKGIIHLQTGKYINPERQGKRLSMTIQEAVKMGLILLKQVDEIEGAEESKDFGLVTIQTLLDCRNFHIKECLHNGKWIGADEARKLHILNESEGVYQTLEEQISLEKAIRSGLVSIEHEESNDTHTEEEAVESYCIRAVVDQKNRVSVPFQEAIERGLLDPKTAEYINNKTGEKVFLVDALAKGFLKVTQVNHETSLESIDPDKRPTVEKVIGLIRRSVVTPISVYNALKLHKNEE